MANDIHARIVDIVAELGPEIRDQLRPAIVIDSTRDNPFSGQTLASLSPGLEYHSRLGLFIIDKANFPKHVATPLGSS